MKTLRPALVQVVAAGRLLVPAALALGLAVLLTPVPHQRLKAAPASSGSVTASFVTAGDTINGDRITDPALIRRIERIAAGVPSNLLSSHSRAARVRYLAQGFGAGDEAPILQGVFRDPAAALAFGCALDDDLGGDCAITAVAGGSAAYEELPGVTCVPMRLALGAAAYEPDRCETGG